MTTAVSLTEQVQIALLSGVALPETPAILGPRDYITFIGPGYRYKVVRSEPRLTKFLAQIKAAARAPRVGYRLPGVAKQLARGESPRAKNQAALRAEILRY